MSHLLMLALVHRDSVVGDPASWLLCTQQADAVKGATRARGARTLIVVVQDSATQDTPDERALQLCKQAGIDRRYCNLYNLCVPCHHADLPAST